LPSRRSRRTSTAISDTVFLVNPASGGGSTGRKWPDLARRAADAGLPGETVHSSAPGEIAALAEHAASNGARLVVAVGGDGTAHEAVNGLLRAGTGTELALLPQGTGDDFARALGVPRGFAQALAVARDGRARTIDVGRVTYQSAGGQAEAFFCSMAGVGMSGAVARRLLTTTKALGGRVAGVIATFAIFSRWTNLELQVAVDGEARAGLMEDVLVANTEYHNGGMRLCPDASPDDGVFDVLLIGDVTKRDLLLTLPKIYRGTHLPHPKAELLRGRTVTVDSEAPLPIELDGEQPGTTPVRFEIVPAALRVRVPKR
jgi:diacylglycerol kinase (ATP)